MILLFPAESEALLQEIYAIPGIARKDGGTEEAVKLGISAKAKDGRLTHSHPFGPQQIEWIQQYAKGIVEVLDELPKDWEPIDENDTPPELGDLELLPVKPPDPGKTQEPDDKTEWEKPPTKPEQDILREIRKAQWQATLPEGEFQK